MEMENEKTSKEISEDDTHQRVHKLLAQISELEKDKQSFDLQRAKMKDLFVKKEDEIKPLRLELDELRSQLTATKIDMESRDVDLQNEIYSLQQVLTETLEQSSKYEEEIRSLRIRNEELKTEVSSLKSTLGEGVLVHPGTMFNSLARKVKSLGVAEPTHNQTENLEESMRKAKEDAEFLKNLVEPLEKEINSLKSMLRETDEELQKYKNQEEKAKIRLQSNSSEVDVGDNALPCDMCLNYEAQLVQSQAIANRLEKQLAVAEKYKEELAKETVFRKQMEEKWNECKEEHKAQVSKLIEQTEKREKSLSEAKKEYVKIKEYFKNEYSQLSEDRKRTQNILESIQKENETLMGKYNTLSIQLHNEKIDLPDNVQKLQEMWLEQREQLIRAMVGKERSEESLKSLECMCNDAQEKQIQFTTRISELENELMKKDEYLIKSRSDAEKYNQHIQILENEIQTLKDQKGLLLVAKDKLEKSEEDLKKRLQYFQTGLENGEAVQKDFVLLSQNLQKELEHIRGQDNVLRWEYEEDVSDCRGCEQVLSAKKKGNCRHCGRIFCPSCLNHKVSSGPHRREAKVCQVCHTLLNSKTAPYFSTEPPQQK